LPSFKEHIPIYEAIRDQNRDRAKEAMEIHMVSATKRLEKTLRAEEERLAETRRPKQNEESTAVVAP
jgi:DNA-binding FadR family transcriptional regulator